MRTMQRVAPGLAMLLATASAVAVGAQQPARGRPLVIEDYYRLQTVGSPAISPSGRWVAFTVSTRIEDDNSTRTETFVVPADASARPLRVAHYGKDIASASWTADSRLEYGAERERWSLDPQNPSAPPHKAAVWPAGATASPDAKWIAFARDKSQSKAERAYGSEFEKRHEERFKGVAFDWKDFQRDGAPFPAPNLRARPAAQLVVRPFDFARGKPAAGGAEKVLVDTDLRPAEIVWHPNGQLLAFTADAAWREELKYGNATLRTVTTDGTVARVTDDDYVYGDIEFSPDGRYLSYARSFGTEMIIRQKLTHGGSRDLYTMRLKDAKPAGPVAKQGEGTWKLDACPMDGGGLAVRDGQIASAWRREHDIYLAAPGKPEVKVGSGMDVAFGANAKGFYVAWTTPTGIALHGPGASNAEQVSATGAFPALVALPDGGMLLAWEEKDGTITTTRL